MKRKRPRARGQGGGDGAAAGETGTGDAPLGGLTGDVHVPQAGLTRGRGRGRGRGRCRVRGRAALAQPSAPENQVGEVGFRTGRGAQPPLLPTGGQRGPLGWKGSWDTRQVLPPGSPVPPPYLA